MSIRRVLPLIVLVGLGAFVGRSAEPEPEVVYAEDDLKGKGIATDGPSLLAYIKARTLSQDDLDRLAATVRRLGDNDFETREKASNDLIAAGRPATHFLKTALTDSDPEIVRRARHCLDEIQSSGSVMASVCRVLAHRKPPGAVAVLLAYLPCNDEETVEESLFAALRDRTARRQTRSVGDGGPDGQARHPQGCCGTRPGRENLPRTAARWRGC